MSILLKTHFDLAKTSLKNRRGRSFLTCLGIAIGIGSIILVLSLVGSLGQLVRSELSTSAGELIIIRPGTDDKDTMTDIVNSLTDNNRYNKSSLNYNDVETIKKLGFTEVSPVALSNNTLVGSMRTVNSASVLATTPAITKLLNLPVTEGVFIKESASKAAVIGRDLSLRLFGTKESIGQTFNLLGQKFLVVGILDETEAPISIIGVDFNSVVIINIDTLAKIDESPQIQQIIVNPSSYVDPAVANSTEEQPVEASATPTIAELSSKIWNTLSDSKSGDKNFEVIYGDNIYSTNTTAFTLVSGMLTIVSAISLLVGGIGVMNIMLVSVAERTHEIGIRKAIGATNLNIFLQFLFESLIICIIGGISGLAFGYVGAFLLSSISPFKVYFSWQIPLAAFLISVVVGTLFGLYPAFKASRKPPIDSLKMSN